MFSRPRIGLVHALLASVAPIEAAFAALWPEAETTSLYDESLYLDFNRSGRLTPEICARVVRLLELSRDSGASAILLSGSLFGEAVRAARETLGVPVLTAYEAMIEEAFAGGSSPRIGLLATASGTARMVREDIERHARECGQRFSVEITDVAGAIEALLRGDRETHDALVLDAAERMSACDVLMLAQFSMAPVAERLPALPGRRVLTSPGSAVVKLRGLVGAS